MNLVLPALLDFCAVFILHGGAERLLNVLQAKVECFPTKSRFRISKYTFWKAKDFTNTVKRDDPVFLAEIMLG